MALGGSAAEVRETVDLSGVDVVLNPDFGDGCATSIRTALDRVRDDADGLVLLLGDQPGVTARTVDALVAGAREHAVGVCAYDDGLGHPLWFHRSMFATLAGLHGDKAVWKLVDADQDVVRVPVAGDVPPDVDTWDDYQALLEDAAMSDLSSAEDVRRRFDEHGYLADEGMATAVFLTLELGLPLLLEGEPGVGKTAAAQVLAKALDAPLVRLQCYEGLTASEALYDWNHQRQLLAIRIAESQHERIGEARPVQRGVPRGAADPALHPVRRSERSGAADRRGRPRRRRVRGAAPGGPRGGVGHRPRARHLHRRAAADRGAHLQPQPGPARRPAPALPLPLAGLPRPGPGRGDPAAQRARRPTSR